MRLVVTSLFVFAASLGADCLPPPPQPGPRPPLGDAAPQSGDASTSSVNACAHLAALRCADGLAANCATTLDRVQATRIMRVDIACILTAHDQAEVKQCGPVCR